MKFLIKKIRLYENLGKFFVCEKGSLTLICDFLDRQSNSNQDFRKKPNSQEYI